MVTWSDIVPHPSVSLITGRRGSGKSTLAYHLLEEFSRQRDLVACVMGLPSEKQHLLPKGYVLAQEPSEFPERACILVDEGSLSFHARRSHSPLNVLMDNMVSLSRQREQTLIVISHFMRKLDINIVTELDALLMKEPSLLHNRMERAEVKDMTREAFTAFRRLSGDRRSFSYVISEGFQGMMQNPPPSFWSEDLSKAWRGVVVGARSVEEDQRPAVFEVFTCTKCGRPAYMMDAHCEYCGEAKPGI